MRDKTMTESTRERLLGAICKNAPGDSCRRPEPGFGERNVPCRGCAKAVDAILGVLAEPSRGMVDVGAAMDRELEWDHSERAVPQVWRAMLTAIREGK